MTQNTQHFEKKIYGCVVVLNRFNKGYAVAKLFGLTYIVQKAKGTDMTKSSLRYHLMSFKLKKQFTVNMACA